MRISIPVIGPVSPVSCTFNVRLYERSGVVIGVSVGECACGVSRFSNPHCTNGL